MKKPAGGGGQEIMRGSVPREVRGRAAALLNPIPCPNDTIKDYIGIYRAFTGW